MTALPEGLYPPQTWASLAARHGIDTGRTVYAIGFNPHWRPTLQRFLQGARLKHVRSPAQVPAGELAVIWGRRDVSLAPDVRLIRLEDGFLRSVGLGAEFARPLSWVIDTRGLYFDATGPSDLEVLLATHEFTAAERQRAQRLLEIIRTAGISKYNVGRGQWPRPATDRSVILVPGQVESDASLRYGAPGIRTNLALVKAVRAANPDAWIVYKPHPDVVAGARTGGVDEHEVRHFCDEVVTDGNIASMLAQVDEVHTLTSLTGFEALIRHKAVTCYGLPFYAGWGLTRDECSCERRTRQLSLEELAVGALMLYPLYVSRDSGEYSTPEQTLEELVAWSNRSPRRQDNLKKHFRRALNYLMGPQ